MKTDSRLLRKQQSRQIPILVFHLNNMFSSSLEGKTRKKISIQKNIDFQVTALLFTPDWRISKDYRSIIYDMISLIWYIGMNSSIIFLNKGFFFFCVHPLFGLEVSPLDQSKHAKFFNWTGTYLRISKIKRILHSLHEEWGLRIFKGVRHWISRSRYLGRAFWIFLRRLFGFYLLLIAP